MVSYWELNYNEPAVLTMSRSRVTSLQPAAELDVHHFGWGGSLGLRVAVVTIMTAST
jgi:hypothetical protein